MSAHPTCLLTRQNHSYPWPAEQRGSSRGAAEGQQRNSSGAALAPHVVWYSHSLLPDQTGSPCWLNTSLGRHVLLHDRALGKWTGPQLGVYGAQGPPTYKGLCSGPTVKKTIEDIVILFVKCRFLNNY